MKEVTTFGLPTYLLSWLSSGAALALSRREGNAEDDDDNDSNTGREILFVHHNVEAEKKTVARCCELRIMKIEWSET